MLRSQWADVIETHINAQWPTSPLPDETGTAWYQALASYTTDDIVAALTELGRTSRFRPSLSQIVQAAYAPPTRLPEGWIEASQDERMRTPAETDPQLGPRNHMNHTRNWDHCDTCKRIIAKHRGGVPYNNARLDDPEVFVPWGQPRPTAVAGSP